MLILLTINFRLTKGKAVTAYALLRFQFVIADERNAAGKDTSLANFTGCNGGQRRRRRVVGFFGNQVSNGGHRRNKNIA